MAASHSNGPISGRIASRVLSLSTPPSQPLHTSESPFRPPRPHWSACRHPLHNFSRFCSKLAERERARRMLRTVRADVTGRGAAIRGREGARPVAGYKSVSVRARLAECGRASGVGGAVCVVGGRCLRLRGAERGRRGLARAAAAAVGPPRPGRRPGERRKGAGGTRPRPAAVMVSAAARPGRGSGGPPWRRRRGLRSLSQQRSGLEGSPGDPGTGGPMGLPVGRVGVRADRKFPGDEGLADPWSGGGRSGLCSLPVGVPGAATPPSPGPIWGFQNCFTKVRWGKEPE